MANESTLFIITTVHGGKWAGFAFQVLVLSKLAWPLLKIQTQAGFAKAPEPGSESALPRQRGPEGG